MRRWQAKIMLIPVLPALLLLLAAGASASDSMFLLGDNCVSCHLTCERNTPEISAVAWKESVHFRPDVTCAACHGGDKYLALPFKKGHMGLPSPAEAEAMCGSCHAQELADFIYLRPMPKKNACTAGCIACHSHHRVAKAEPGLINEQSCGACHKPDKAKDAIAASRKLARERRELVSAITSRKQAGLPVDYATETLAAIDREAARAFHSAGMIRLSAALAEGPGKKIAALGNRLGRDSPAGFRFRGALALGFILAAIVILAFIFRSLPRQGGKK